MPGIRTSAAAELLGVSPSTLRTWERRLGYPSPERTPGNHRQYDLAEIEALREALRETGNISSAVDVAQRRGRGPSSPARLVAAFDRFDEAAADRELEESLAVRSVERTVEEVLLPALELAADRAWPRGRARARLALGDRLDALLATPGRSRDTPRGRAAAGLRGRAWASRPCRRWRSSSSFGAPGCECCCSRPSSSPTASARAAGARPRRSRALRHRGAPRRAGRPSEPGPAASARAPASTATAVPSLVAGQRRGAAARPRPRRRRRRADRLAGA